MHFAVLGTGDVGKALARGLKDHGHDVTIGTRDPSRPALVEWLEDHPGIQAATFQDAAAAGDAAILAVGWNAARPVCDAIAAHMEGKLLIDATNPLRFEGEGPPTLAVGGDTSAGEQVQAWLSDARVVKCWNIVGNPHMVDPEFEGTPTMFIAGDDAAAKQTVTDLLHEVGWKDVVDLGGIVASRYLEPLAMVWIRTFFATGSGDMSLALVRK